MASKTMPTFGSRPISPDELKAIDATEDKVPSYGTGATTQPATAPEESQPTTAPTTAPTTQRIEVIETRTRVRVEGRSFEVVGLSVNGKVDYSQRVKIIAVDKVLDDIDARLVDAQVTTLPIALDKN